MENKTNLIKSLKTAVRALENETVSYNWQEQSSCNCGVVSQAVLGKSKDEIFSLYCDVVRNLPKKNNSGYTWKECVQHTCDITGKTSKQIFKDLSKAGLSVEDICHLEFLENPAILERANLYTTETVTVKTKTGETVKTIPVSKTIKAKGLKGLFGGTEIIITQEKQIEEVFETKVEQKKILEKHYFSKKENLIKYLKAWVQILEEQAKPITAELSKSQLQEELLKAESVQNFEKCAELRDMIAVK